MSNDIPADAGSNAEGFQFLIVAARFNSPQVEALLERTVATLLEAGAVEEDIEVLRVPGSHEVPQGISLSLELREEMPDAVIALGVVVGGATSHHEVIAHSTAIALQTLALDLSVPVINGIIVVDNVEQANQRCSGALDRGYSFAAAAVEMAAFRDDLDPLDDE